MSVTASDGRVSKKITNFKKSVDRVQSLAEIIVYSMAVDGPSPTSNTATPSGAVTPVPAAVSRLQASTKMQHSPSSDSLAAAGKKSEAAKAYLGGSKALDHLAKLITACETVCPTLSVLY
jgi:proteasome activator subunit 4